MDNNEITITQALNQLQSWLNAKEYDKVIQGAQEILQIEAGNQRAMALMRKAEDERHAAAGGMASEASHLFEAKEEAKPEPMPEPKPEPMPEPKPEPTPSPVRPTPAFEPEERPAPKQEEKVEEAFEKTFGGFDNDEKIYKSDAIRHLLAMLIPAILVILIGGLIIWYISDSQRDEVIGDIEDQQNEDGDAYIEENEDRARDLAGIAKVIEAFKKEHGSYPAKDQIEKILIDSGEFKEVPSDPRQGELDKAGKDFAYIYAVYDTEEGKNMEYIISAIFESDKGFAYPWTRGASTKVYTDYRDLDSDNTVLIGGDGKSGEEDSKPKVKVKR